MPRPSKTWKQKERDFAKRFGSLRQRLSGSSGREDESSADMKHDRIYAEVKYRDKHALFTLYEDTAKKARKEGKLPIVALAQKGTSDFIVCVHISHLAAIAAELVRDDAIADATEGFYEQE